MQLSWHPGRESSGSVIHGRRWDSGARSSPDTLGVSVPVAVMTKAGGQMSWSRESRVKPEVCV